MDTSNDGFFAEIDEHPVRQASALAPDRSHLFLLLGDPMTREAHASAPEIENVNERIAQLTAHRACHAAEHAPLSGRIHGYCIVCGVPWPCEYAGAAPPTAVARGIIRELASVYTVDTDQVALIGLVQRAKVALLTDVGLPQKENDETKAEDDSRRASPLVPDVPEVDSAQRVVGVGLPHQQQEHVHTRAQATVTPPQESNEVCVCAALLLDDGRIIRGHRHDDCIGTYGKWRNAGQNIPPMTRQEQQGFLTSRGRFVSREEGAALMRAVSHVSPYSGKQFDANILFSEDLY